MEQYLGYSIDLISFHIILLAIEEDFSIYIVLFTVRMLEIGVSEHCVDLLSMLNAISTSIHLYIKLNADVCPTIVTPFDPQTPT